MSIEMENEMNETVNRGMSTIAIGIITFVVTAIIACMVLVGGFFAIGFLSMLIFGAILGAKSAIFVMVFFLGVATVCIWTGLFKKVLKFMIMSMFDKLMEKSTLNKYNFDEPEATVTGAQPAA